MLLPGLTIIILWEKPRTLRPPICPADTFIRTSVRKRLNDSSPSLGRIPRMSNIKLSHIIIAKAEVVGWSGGIDNANGSHPTSLQHLKIAEDHHQTVNRKMPRSAQAKQSCRRDEHSIYRNTRVAFPEGRYRRQTSLREYR